MPAPSRTEPLPAFAHRHRLLLMQTPDAGRIEVVRLNEWEILLHLSLMKPLICNLTLFCCLILAIQLDFAAME